MFWVDFAKGFGLVLAAGLLVAVLVLFLFIPRESALAIIDAAFSFLP